MKNANFYSAWCLLERVEIGLHNLLRHFDITANDDEYKLYFIKTHTEKFQSLYPYKLYMSPGMFHLEKVCTICRKPLTIRNHCDHLVGEIYDGEMCGREITKLRLLEISLVPNPVQKYSVPFMTDPKTKEQVDHYNYSLVNYVIRGLRTPFDGWDVRWTKTRHSHSRYKHVGRNDDCPCNSGRKYKNCCLKENGVLRPHAEVHFEKPPPENLPAFEYAD